MPQGDYVEAQMKKTLAMHEESSTRRKVDDDVHEGAVPAYLMDRETTTRAKILSNTIKKKGKEKAGKWEVPLPKKKMKIWKNSNSEDEGKYANSDYFNKLPDDVIASLFLRCSLKSLSMLRCTSKLWNNFIITPSFLHSHLTKSTENGPKLLFLVRKSFHRSKSSRLRFVSVDMDGRQEELYTVIAPDTQLTVATVQVYYGLVFFSTNFRFYLCNPAMKQLCELPKYSPSATFGYDDFGFGYLHSRKEYKVVHYFYMGPQCVRINRQRAPLKFEVLTLNRVGGVSFNGWKEIADTPPCHPFRPGLLVTECMYWLTISKVHQVHPTRILSFDFENDKFLTISAPSSFKDPIMMDLKGMVCLSDTDHFRRSSILDLWILKDKISCTWVHEYSVNLVNFEYKNITSDFSTFNEEIIFRYNQTVVFYDLKRKCFRGVEQRGLYRGVSTALQQYGIYSKSLFSLGSM